MSKTASIRTTMPDEDIAVVADLTGIPVDKVRGIVWLAEKHLREFAQVTEGLGGEYVEDGFGGAWVKCDDPRCDLEVVRPGKVQCSDFCDESNGSTEATSTEGGEG